MDAILQIVLMHLCVAAVALDSVIPPNNASNVSQFDFDGSSSGYIITAGGYNNPNFLTNTYAIDLNSGVWKNLPPLPHALCCSSLVLRDSSVYADAGQNSPVSYSKNTLILSTAENMWKTGTDLLYSSGCVLSASINGSIYAVGGYPANNVVQVMACNGPWRRLSPSIYTHDGATDGIVVINGRIYIQGCHHQDEVYDPSTDTWSAINMTNQDRCGGGIVALNGYIYVVGGADSKNERYDPATGEIVYFAKCLFNMVQYAAIVTDGEKIYVIGGQIGGDYINKVQVYRPDLDLWQSRSEYPISASWIGAVYVKELPTD